MARLLVLPFNDTSLTSSVSLLNCVLALSAIFPRELSTIMELPDFRALRVPMGNASDFKKKKDCLNHMVFLYNHGLTVLEQMDALKTGMKPFPVEHK